MRPVEAFITYLAIGSPLAMMYFLRNRRMPLAKLVALTLATLLCWLPILLINTVRSALTGQREEQTDVRAPSAAKIQRQLREIAGLTELTRDGANLREALDRYAALTTAVRLTVQNSEVPRFELFAVSGNRNEHVGSVCLTRLNRKKLAVHQQRASDDLIGAVKTNILESGVHNTRLQKMILLAEDLDDAITAGKIRECLSSPATSDRPIRLETVRSA